MISQRKTTSGHNVPRYDGPQIHIMSGDTCLPNIKQRNFESMIVPLDANGIIHPEELPSRKVQSTGLNPSSPALKKWDDWYNFWVIGYYI
jgi:hypothetical protein